MTTLHNKPFKMGYHLMCPINNPNMNQPIQIHEIKHPYLRKQGHCTKPCTYLVHPKSKPNIDLSFLNLSPHTSTIPTKLIHYLISKSLQNPSNKILIKYSQYMFPIKLLYNFLNHITPKTVLPIPNPFNYIENSQMGRYAFEVRNPLSNIPCMTNCW